MTIPPWRELRREGPMTIVEVMVEPGRTAEIPVRTDIVGTPMMDTVIAAMITKHEDTQEILRDFG